MIIGARAPEASFRRYLTIEKNTLFFLVISKCCTLFLENYYNQPRRRYVYDSKALPS